MRLIGIACIMSLVVAEPVLAQEVREATPDVRVRTLTCDANSDASKPGSCVVRHNGEPVQLFEAEVVVVPREAAKRLCEAWLHDLERRLEETRTRIYVEGAATIIASEAHPIYSMSVLNEVTKDIGANGQASDFCSGIESKPEL